ncbi:hypothetical protein CHUAL_012948 [Chamberlinius hualienensis]
MNKLILITFGALLLVGLLHSTQADPVPEPEPNPMPFPNPVADPVNRGRTGHGPQQQQHHGSKSKGRICSGIGNCNGGRGK